MAIALVVDFPSACQEHYDAVLRELGVGLGAELVPGRLFHAAGPYEDGWRVVDVWESQDAFDTYFEGTLEAASKSSGMPQPTPPQVFEVYNLER